MEDFLQTFDLNTILIITSTVIYGIVFFVQRAQLRNQSDFLKMLDLDKLKQYVEIREETITLQTEAEKTELKKTQENLLSHNEELLNNLKDLEKEISLENTSEAQLTQFIKAFTLSINILTEVGVSIKKKADENVYNVEIQALNLHLNQVFKTYAKKIDNLMK